MKRRTFFIASTSLSAALAVLLQPHAARAATTSTPTPVRIGAAPGPNAEILAHVGGLAAQHGLALQLALVDTDHALDAQLERGALDAACFADGVGFADESRRDRRPLVVVAPTVTLPMALYSRRLRTPRGLRDGDTIAVPDDTAQLARALVLLQNFGLVTLRDDIGLHATLHDVIGNRLSLRLVRMAPAKLYAALPRVAVAVMSSADAVRAGLEPARDSIGLEDARSPWAGVLAVRADRVGEAWIAPLLASYRSEDVKRFLLERYRDSVRRPW